MIFTSRSEEILMTPSQNTFIYYCARPSGARDVADGPTDITNSAHRTSQYEIIPYYIKVFWSGSSDESRRLIENPLKKTNVFQHFHLQNTLLYKGILNQNGRTGGGDWGGSGLQVVKIIETAPDCLYTDAEPARYRPGPSAIKGPQIVGSTLVIWKWFEIFQIFAIFDLKIMLQIKYLKINIENLSNQIKSNNS